MIVVVDDAEPTYSHYLRSVPKLGYAVPLRGLCHPSVTGRKLELPGRKPRVPWVRAELRKLGVEVA